ncbi:MAG: hypothetical protein IJQ01_08525 [Selenomonadaceae bacterium]|nr:hypothetical protein [Selenomonadaceae bacterium]
MNILKTYSKALKLYRAKNYDEALKIVTKVKAAAPHWDKPFLLEVFIRREQGERIKTLPMLEKLLPRLKYSSPEDKAMAAEAFNCLGSVNRFIGRNEEAVRAFCLSASLSHKNNNACDEISNALFTASSAENFSAEDFQALYAEYKKYLADIVPYPKKFYEHKKIRVGFVSANFQWSVVMSWSWYFFNGTFDDKAFAIYCYSNVKEPDNVTELFRKVVKNWRDIYGLTDEATAKLIRDDEIDILFDLDGHTQNNRLRVAAYRPASVQIAGVGYMNSTGLDCFDYFLSDVYCAGDESYFTEELIVLPHSHICYESPIKIEPAAAPPCLRNNFVTFGSFNNFAKVTDSILIAWKKILDAVPDSRLLLKHKIFSNDDGREFVSERMKNFGFDLARVEMRGFSDHHYLVEYGDMDIALDTFPYTGGVTTCEALYMGVPVVSLYGDRHGTRFGLSLLSNIGIGELAVASYDDYVGWAVILASDWELLAILRKNLRVMMKKSPLMDSAGYIREVEQAFIKVLNEARQAE